MTDKTLQERLRAMVPQGRPFTVIERFDAEQTAKEAADALDAKDARITELQAALDSHHADVGSNIWRFWSDKATEMACKLGNARLDGNAKDAEIARLKATCDQLQPLAEQWVSHLEAAFDASDDDGAIYADWQDALSTLKAAIQALHK